MSKVVIDLNDLIVSSNKAGDFIINNQSQELLIKIKNAKDKIDDIYRTALQKVHEQAVEYNPDVKTIDSKKVRVTFAPTGSKYTANLEKVDEKFIKTVKSLNTDEVEEYYEHHLSLPDGVNKNAERGLSIRLKVKDETL